MNRIVKFRAWDSVGNRMLDFSSENPLKVGDKPLVKEFVTVMQFTGLHDKNGKECYENDLVRVYGKFNEFGVVEYSNNAGAFGVRTIPNGMEMGMLDFDEFEVIGNIYSNPELIN